MRRRTRSSLKPVFNAVAAAVLGIAGGLYVSARLKLFDEKVSSSGAVAETAVDKATLLEAGYELEDALDTAEGKVMPPRLLTKGERQLVRCIFGDAVDASGIEKRVRSKDDPRRDDGGIVAQAAVRYLDVDDIIYYGGEGWSPNYAREMNVEKFDTFIHEMTHIWQNQTGRAFTGGQPELTESNKGEIYRYMLCSGEKFSDYPAEEQAAILADYACRFIHPARRTPKNCENASTETDRLLRKVVEDMFPAARETRLAIRAAEKSRASPSGNTVK